MTTRLKPSQDQIQYLLRVGVPVAELGELAREVGAPSPASIPAPCIAPVPHVAPARGGFLGWLDRVFRFLLCTILLAVGPRCGAEPSAPMPAFSWAAIPVDTNAQAPAQETTVDEEQIAQLWSAIKQLESQTSAVSEANNAILDRLPKQLEKVESTTSQLLDDLAENQARWKETSSRVGQQDRAQAALIASIQEEFQQARLELEAEQAGAWGEVERLSQMLGRLEATTNEINTSIVTQDEDLQRLQEILLANGQSDDETAGTLEVIAKALYRVTMALALILAITCILALTRYAPYVRLPRLISHAPSRTLRPSAVPSSELKPISDQKSAAKHGGELPLSKAAGKPGYPKGARRSVEQLFKLLSRWMRRFPNWKLHLKIPQDVRRLGFATCCGNVRERNEDFGCAFALGSGNHDKHHVLIIADGVGGRPFGADASYIAARAAAASLNVELGRSESISGDARQKAAENAMEAAKKAIARAAKRRGIINPNDGLQTTLIIAVCPPGAGPIGYAYIGDGMGICAGPDIHGEARSFMIPQKADLLQSNLLAACLGPEVLGSACSGQFERKESELVMIATDGVADRVSPRFAEEFLGHLQWARGDATAACESVLQHMADQQDQGGFVCDDNMTMAVTGAVPARAENKAGSNGKVQAGVLAPVA